ncbi:MAG: carbonic anhydrase [Bryobacteraceae bacterium]
MKKLIEGVSKFQRDVYPRQRQLFERLAQKQQPSALFITCSDSRIDPTLITQTMPGELFICRNVGNMVPAHGEVAGGVSATIEYAVMALKVKAVIVCGHSGCGAMHGLLSPEKVASMPSVASWLKYGETARFVVEQNYTGLPTEQRLVAITEQNVIAQINNLKTHPGVAAAVQRGDLELHGWYYEIETGAVSAFSPGARQFVPVGEEVAIVAGKSE